MKARKRSKRMFAAILFAIYLMMMVPLPAMAFTEEAVDPLMPVSESTDGEAAPAGDTGSTEENASEDAAPAGDTGSTEEDASEDAAPAGDTGSTEEEVSEDAATAGDTGSTEEDASEDAAPAGDTGSSEEDASEDGTPADDTGSTEEDASEDAAPADDTGSTEEDASEDAAPAGDSSEDGSAASADSAGSEDGTFSTINEMFSQPKMLLASVLPVASGSIGDPDNESSEGDVLDVDAEPSEGYALSAGEGSLTNTASAVSYVYDAALYEPDSENYPGVYTATLETNTLSAEQAKTEATIGMPSIADKNLDKPTTESPAIIQGAAVGYDEKTGATEYTHIAGRPQAPEPYSEFPVKVIEETTAAGTHQKLSGFDGTYVIVRLDVSNFLSAGSDNLYLHMQQKDNKALMPAAVAAKPAADAATTTTITQADYTPVNVFTDGLGNRSASYNLSDLRDGSTPFLDVILYATAANVAGADAGKQNVANGDVPLALYVDSTLRYDGFTDVTDLNNLPAYDPSTLDQNDPNAATAYDNSWHAKFFDEAKAAANAISRYLVKGSDLALETSVEKSDSTGEKTTYWSLKKSIEDPYYDDKAPAEAECGTTVKLMSEVAVTENLTLEGTAENPKKRTLDVNSFDVQVASNTAGAGDGYSDGFTLKNGWLTIADNSNTTGAEMAIGNNAKFVIDDGGKLIIDDTCQLEIEWDGATTTPATDGSTPAQQDVLNNGQLDLRAGGEIVNNGIISIEGTEGKPIQPGSEQSGSSEKGSGEMAIAEGATLTNNGALVVYGKLNNLGTLVNNGKYDDVIKSNDPDKGAFDYHKGIQVAWKDDVTQQNVVEGSLTNGTTGTLINNGDIVLVPGTLENSGTFENRAGANIYSAAVSEAIIPITPDAATPTVVTKRITLSPVKTSSIVNTETGTLINDGSIMPATVALLDNTGGFSTLTPIGSYPELFIFKNNGNLINNGYIYSQPESSETSGAPLLAALTGSVQTANDMWLYLYEDGTFLMILPDGQHVTGTYSFREEMLVFTLKNGTVVAPAADEEGNFAYSITTPSGSVFEFVLTSDFVAAVRADVEKRNG